MLGSYVAAHCLQSYAESASLAQLGLSANPGDFTLLNNLAFALAHLGRVADARRHFERIHAPSLPPQSHVVWLATNGLLHYREGNPNRGRELYLASIAEASKLNDRKRRALALLFLAIEELGLGTPDAHRYRAEALDTAHLVPDPDLLPVVRRLER